MSEAARRVRDHQPNAPGARPRGLRTRIVWAFAGFAIAVALVFGASTAVFLYAVEDEFFTALLGEEAGMLEHQRTRQEQWGTPRHAWMSVHQSTSTMPGDLGPQVNATPSRREFRGTNGRHYHLHPLGGEATEGAVPKGWLVAEVSSRLVVRPRRLALLEKWLVAELLILLLAVAIALRIAHRIARPLSTLATAVRAFDPSLPPRPLADAGADAEVMVVARAIAEMRDRVQELVARERAFTRDVSHELRTPLSVIRSTAAQALHDPGITSDSRRMLTMALQSAEQMERTVVSLLALARDTPLGEPALPSRVLPMLEQVVIEQSTVIRGREISLDIEVPQGAALDVSAAMLHVLLSNLVGNAFSHTASGVVRVSFSDGQLVLRNPVGGGDELDALTRDLRDLAAPGVRREDSPGFGFGLDIARRVCDRAGLALQWRLDEGEFEVRLGGLAARPLPTPAAGMVALRARSTPSADRTRS